MGEPDALVEKDVALSGPPCATAAIMRESSAWRASGARAGAP